MDVVPVNQFLVSEYMRDSEETILVLKKKMIFFFKFFVHVVRRDGWVGSNTILVALLIITIIHIIHSSPADDKH